METNEKLPFALNDIEFIVLKACFAPGVESEDNYFQSEDVKVEGLTKNQIKGYLSQLKQKGFIDTQENCYFSAFYTNRGRWLFECKDDKETISSYLK